MKLGIICKKHKKETMHFEAGKIFENNDFAYVQNDYLNQFNTFASSYVQDSGKCLKENETGSRNL